MLMPLRELEQEAADRAIRIILGAPDRWSIIEGEVRHYLMPRFPYAIYYPGPT